MSRSSNTSVKRCPETISTNCIEWVGSDIPCLEICTGDSLTSAQYSIATKLCEVVGDIDMSTLVIPDCLKNAWDILNEEQTIFNLLEFAFSSLCNQQAQIDLLPTTNDPIIVLDYKCCTDNECFTGVEVAVSKHLQQILDCICEQHDLIVALTQTVADLTTEVASVKSTANTANTNAADWVALRSQIIGAINCLTELPGSTCTPITV